MQKLKRLKVDLRTWNKHVFWGIDAKVAKLNQKLSTIQNQVYNLGDSEQLLDREIEATVELNQILRQEQQFYAQKNRASWLTDGYRNTAFFQRLHRVKKARSGTNALYIDGVLSTEQWSICAHIERFYSSLFSGSSDGFDSDRCEICRGNARCLKSILDTYADLSGQVFNPNKSKAYFGRHVSAQNKAYFRTILQIGSASLPFTYLGVSLLRGAPKAAHLRSVADCIIAKFVGWKGSALSLAGRACVVNSVIVSSLVHSMMIYRWPRSLLKKNDIAIRNFIWTGSMGRKVFCTVSWQKLCASREEEGLGIRSIQTAN
ncbi:hypothetical protein ACS0TY_026292 [Phlomoides rotata]